MDEITYLFLVLLGVIGLTCVYRMCWLYPWVWRHRISLNESFNDMSGGGETGIGIGIGTGTGTGTGTESIPVTDNIKNNLIELGLSEEADIASKKQQESELISVVKDVVREENRNKNVFSNQPTLQLSGGGKQCSGGGGVTCPLLSGGKYGTPGVLQGLECLTKKQQQCLQNPDEFVRKDSIPCWGCSL